MKKIVFDFIRSPYERITQVEKGLAPKESLLGYYYLKSANYPVEISNKKSTGSHRLNIHSIKYKIDLFNTADVIVIASRFSILLALIARTLGKKTIFYDSMQTLPRGIIAREKIRIAIGLSHKSIFFSSNQLKQWQRVFPQLKKKGHSILYGIDSDFFKPNSGKVENDFTDQYISVGRDPSRDFQILNKVFKDKTKKLSLITKEYLLNTDLKTNSSIDILDELTYDELKTLYLKSKATIIPILPGTTHLSGIRAAMESMANKTLVIIARNKSLEEYFEDLKHVIFYEPGSPESLLEAIQLSQNEGIRDRLVTNSYLLVTK